MVHLLLVGFYYIASEALIFLVLPRWILLTASPVVMITHISGFLMLLLIAQRHAMRKSRVFAVALLVVVLATSFIEYALARSMYIEKFDLDYFLLPANYDGILTSGVFAGCARLFIAAVLLYVLRHLSRRQQHASRR